MMTVYYSELMGFSYSNLVVVQLYIYHYHKCFLPLYLSMRIWGINVATDKMC